MPLAEASGAICVQRFDDSRNSAIHTTYRISLRSSSLREPRYPLLRVVFGWYAASSKPITCYALEWLRFGVWLVELKTDPSAQAESPNRPQDRATRPSAETQAALGEALRPRARR